MSDVEQRDAEGTWNGGEGGDRRPYRPPTCFNCNEAGHYANQCPYRSRRLTGAARPSSSSDSLRSRSPRRHGPGQDAQLYPSVRAQIAEMGKNFAVMEHFHAERAKQEKKAAKKREKEEAMRREEEAKQREAEEKARRERKAMKRKEKARHDAEHQAETRKDFGIQMAIMMNEMQGNLVKNWRNIVGGQGCTAGRDKGKKKVVYESEEESSADCSGEESETSVPQEISERAERLCIISEKHKRGPDPVFENSPPMERTSKRTPRQGSLKPTKLTTRPTRSKVSKTMKTPGSAKRRSPVMTPLSRKKNLAAKKKSPGGNLTPISNGALARLRYMNTVMKELKNLDSTELQRICKEEGIHYDKKVDVIFNIAEHCTTLTFDCELKHEPEVIRIAESTDDEAMSGQPDAFDGRSRLRASQLWVVCRYLTSLRCLPFPRKEWHVVFHLSDLKDVHPLAINAKNVPRARLANHLPMLHDELSHAFKDWRNLQGPPTEVPLDVVESCVSSSGEAAKSLDLQVVFGPQAAFERSGHLRCGSKSW
ncbi:hypothetical protein CBR_g37966 [Chara braunii]|uniref:CCHC-type domain-containing protein n=1 Tax=Chara braunii TaxID=69332 RepID=A0A388LP89_CHABU|nr:hypothetical protein CBR_g37966 [Chara braunii]|eukprot:GBG84091.1 hypothetical protein CBR_g37966 [Chara braunii]